MAVRYIIYQQKRKGGNNLFYGRAIQTHTVSFKDVCKMVQENCSAKESDVRMVLTEFISQMQFYLQNGYKVQWEGIGVFRIRASFSGAITLDEFNIRENLKKPQLSFLATATRASGVVSRAFTNAVTFEKATGSVK